MVLAAAFAGSGCSGGTIGTPGTGGGGGGGTGGVIGIGGTIGDSLGEAGTTGAGGAAGSGPACSNEPSVIGCGAISALQVGLAPGGGAVVSYRNLEDDSTWIKSWDTSAGGWKVIKEDHRQPLQSDSPPVLSVDSQGRPVIATAIESDTWVGFHAARWNGTGWESLDRGLPSITDGFRSFDLEIDAMDRPVLLADQPRTGGRLTVFRWDGSTWAYLGAPPINARPSAFARLAIDSGDGITPYVAYEPVDEDTKIIALRFDGTGWSAYPALTRGLNGDFDIAVAGGQVYLAYLDVPLTNGAHIYLSTLGPSGWSSGTRLDADVDKPVVTVRLMTTGPGTQDLVLGWEAEVGTDMHQVYVKRAPAWSLVPKPVPLSGDMTGFALATGGTRDAIVWRDRYGAPPFAGYLEMAR